MRDTEADGWECYRIFVSSKSFSTRHLLLLDWVVLRASGREMRIEVCQLFQQKQQV